MLASWTIDYQMQASSSSWSQIWHIDDLFPLLYFATTAAILNFPDTNLALVNVAVLRASEALQNFETLCVPIGRDSLGIT